MPFSPQNSPKFLSSRKHYEASTILVYPNGMKFLQCLHMPKWSYSTNFQPYPIIQVSAASWYSFWTRLCSCEATMLNLGPNLFKIHRRVVLPTLNLCDILVNPYPIPFDHNIMPKFATANCSWSLPSAHSGFLRSITSGRSHFGRTTR